MGNYLDRLAKQKKVSKTLVLKAPKRRVWVKWLSVLQRKAKSYAKKLGVQTDEDAEKLLDK